MTFWGRRIAAAKKRGTFTEYDRTLSRKWTTCACGKQDKRIPRMPMPGYPDSDMAPKDTMLWHLGRAFHLNVVDNNFSGALQTLAAIEKRAACILRHLPVHTTT